MADFAAVLRKTLDGMTDPGPDVRAKVYERARATIARQIEAMPKRPSDAAIERQYEKLDAAIAEVEAGYGGAPVEDEIAAALAETPAEEEAAPPPPVIAEQDAPAEEAEEEDEAETAEEVEPVDEIFGEGHPADEPVYDAGTRDGDTAARRDTVPPESYFDDIERHEEEVFSAAEVDPLAAYLAEQEVESHPRPETEQEITPEAAVDEIWEARAEKRDDHAAAPVDETLPAEDEERARSPRRRTGLVLLAIVLLLLAGAAVAGYVYQNQILAFVNDMTGTGGQKEAQTAEPAAQKKPASNSTASSEKTASQTTEDGVPVRSVPSKKVTLDETQNSSNSAQADSSQEVASNDTGGDTGNADGESGPQKFTQRLTADGKEVDAGAATQPQETGEGTSVAGRSDTNSSASEPAAGTDATASDQSGPEVGQRAIFYQERTGGQAGTAQAGSVVWSEVQESPGGDAPPEPAIRAEANIPDLGMTMEMTVRRNADDTFPASHVIELFFQVPNDFEGRGIADVQRITFKGTEQDPGNALIGVPAALDTNIFMLALTDASTAIETNTNLMKREDWIDIPMQYVSGRRALITLEKGIPGEQVFNKVLAAWEANPLEKTPSE